MFKPYMDKFIIAFIDDIIIYFKTAVEHPEHIRIALQTLKEHKPYAKLSKCEFLFTKVTFLISLIPTNYGGPTKSTSSLSMHYAH